MFAVVNINGMQYKVQPAERVYVPRLPHEVGSTVKFNDVLLVANERGVRVGSPTVEGVSVEAKVLGHVRDDKVVVFKKKRRKGYRVRRGHRQQYTELEITKIG